MSSANRNGALSLAPSYYDALRRLTLELAGINLGANHTFLVKRASPDWRVRMAMRVSISWWKSCSKQAGRDWRFRL